MASVEHRSLPDLVYHDLLAEIMEGKRSAGSKLSEESICRDLGVSRTPAREALMLLYRDGLVDRIPRRGCFVKAFDLKEAADLFECRSLIECQALSLGFEAIPDAELEQLEKGLCGRSGQNRRRSLELDDRLHALIIEACPNRNLREIAARLLKKTYPFRLSRTYQSRKVSGITDERLAIVRAIRKGRKVEAARLLSEHILRGKEMMEALAAGSFKPGMGGG